MLICNKKSSFCCSITLIKGERCLNVAIQRIPSEILIQFSSKLRSLSEWVLHIQVRYFYRILIVFKQHLKRVHSLVQFKIFCEQNLTSKSRVLKTGT